MVKHAKHLLFDSAFAVKIATVPWHQPREVTPAAKSNHNPPDCVTLWAFTKDLIGLSNRKVLQTTH